MSQDAVGLFYEYNALSMFGKNTYERLRIPEEKKIPETLTASVECDMTKKFNSFFSL